MDTNEHASSQITVVVIRMWHRHKLTGYQGLEVLGPGAVAHMSLHHNLTMSKSHPTKEADNKGAPIFTGGPVVRLMLATVTIRAGEKPSAPRR
ncbi:MAG: hypothetical protein ABJP48_10805 [Erythrobacter sp.]